MEKEKEFGRVARAEEVLMYLTDVLRGESEDDPKTMSTRMKAAELLGRKLGAFDEGEEEKEAVVIVDDVTRAKKTAKKAEHADAPEREERA